MIAGAEATIHGEESKRDSDYDWRFHEITVSNSDNDLRLR